MLNLRNRDNGDGRREEVKNILDSNLDAYRRVFNLEKDWVSTFQESIKPSEQENKEAVETSQKNVEKVSEILNKKINLMDTFSSKIPKGGNIKAYDTIYNTKLFSELVLNEDFIRSYNELVRTYINPENSQTTREQIKNNIMTIQPLINKLSYGLGTIIGDDFFKFRTKNEDFYFIDEAGIEFLTPVEKGLYVMQMNFIKTYLEKALKALSIYSFVEKNLFRNNFVLIQPNDINNEYSNIYGKLSADPNIKIILDSIEREKKIINDEAYIRRANLIREDQALPLSEEQLLTLRNTMFGAPERKPEYTADEIRTMEEADRLFSEERQKEVEAKTKQAEDRIAMGLPPVGVPDEIPAPYYGEVDNATIFKAIDKQLEDYKKFIKSGLYEVKTTVGVGVIAPRAAIKKFRDDRFKEFAKLYFLVYEEKPELNDILDTSFPLLTNANLNSPYFLNSATKKRNIRKSLDDLVDYYLEPFKNEKDVNDILKTRYLPKPLVGQGMPRFSNFYNPLYFDDRRNDPYLVN